jgi:hypothetical protein
MLWFEFISGLDHSFHIMSEATQDNWRHIHEDLKRLTQMFTYADKQQNEAVKKEEKKQKRIAQMELAFGIITAVLGLLSAGTNVMNFDNVKMASAFNSFIWSSTAVTRWQRAINTVGKLGRSSRLSTFKVPKGLDKITKDHIGNMQSKQKLKNFWYLS